MKRGARQGGVCRGLGVVAVLFPTSLLWAAEASPFPRDLNAYADPANAGVWAVIKARAAAEPFNVVVTAIFALAVLHTFFCPKFLHAAHGAEPGTCRARLWHVLGEVELVFGLWVIVLVLATLWARGAAPTMGYLSRVSFTEPLFVIVIMALAATRPVMRLAEQSLRLVASLGGGRPVAWWFSILTVAPLLGSLITEPAAMTISALLLSKQFYDLKPSTKLMYATLGLLFVNISIGGTLTHFAAPPVLMVAAPWGWDMAYMATHFGGHAVGGIVVSTGVYFLIFRRELLALQPADRSADKPGALVPVWVTLIHLVFLGYTVWAAHHPLWFLAGFALFLGFVQATRQHQDKLGFRSPLLVGFFLAGLVVHGGLQGWWIEPVLGGLGATALFFGATLLTAFNDNALITYLATLVPGFTENLKFAVVAGAVTGGGLTVIANAPNPAGQSILQRYFPDGISPLGLLLGALGPTLIVVLTFMVL